jgi:uncharacterized oligopeptide transporter (OPT) family protein
MPLKRQLVNVEQLPFPSGAAAAETIRRLHGQEGSGGARALLRAFAVGLVLEWLTTAMPIVAPLVGLPAWLSLPSSLPTPWLADAVPVLGAAAAYTFTLELSVLLPAAGVFVGWHVAWSMLLGAAICWGVVAPRLVAGGVVQQASWSAISAWAVWPGTTMMVVAGLLGVALQHRTLRRALRGLSRRRHDVLADLEVPPRWYLAGSALAGSACVVLLRFAFDVPIAMAMLAVVLAGLLAIVAARITGETDITPPGPLGKIGQLTFGALMPGRALPNVVTAGVAAGAAASAADLLTDLRSGWLLGAHPRKQFVAQAVGVLVGAIAIVPVFRYVLVPRADVLGTAQWPAPAAKMWASVAELVSVGLEGLHPSVIVAMACSAAVATILVLVTRFVPRLRAFVPSPIGIGLAFVLPAASSIAFFIGGAIALVATRRAPAELSTRVVPIAAGLIAGESLMGIVAAVLGAAAR